MEKKKRKGRRSVQISDVAKRAGVSPATVSVVVNNRIGENIRVSPETAERVRKAVKELEYFANPVAQRLAAGSTNIIGLFTYESIFPIKQNNFYYPFLVGIEEEVERQGYDLLLFTSTGSSEKQRSVFKDGVSRLNMTEGSILLGLNEDKEDLVTLLKQNYPFVFVGRREIPDGEISFVAADYEQATANIISHIAGYGHKNIAYLHLKIKRESQIDRHKGFMLGLENAGIMYEEDNDLTIGPSGLSENDLSKWLDKGVTAFIVEDNGLAEQLLSAAEKSNKNPGKDFSLAVLGDSIDPQPPSIDWTMFRIPRREMGIEAIKMLITMLEDESDPSKLYQKTLECTFIPGSTVGPAP